MAGLPVGPYINKNRQTGQRANGLTLIAMQQPVRSLRFVQSEHIFVNYYKRCAPYAMRYAILQGGLNDS